MTAPNANAPACSGDIWALIHSIKNGVYPWWYPDAAKSVVDPSTGRLAPPLAIDFFQDGADFLPVPAGQSLTQPINIDGGSAFVICQSVLVCTETDNVTFLANAPLKNTFIDTSSQRLLGNIPIHVANLFGTAQRPYIWPVPKIVAPNATLQITLQNLGTIDLNVQVVYSGFKIFNFPAA